jgi:hypothetical protein
MLSYNKHFGLVQSGEALALALEVEQKYMGTTLLLHDTLHN